ncbi:hypothetical protein EWM64_g9078 [Hericium alpestre]|uniref:DUF6593 domain-containing protein n=1 Tax=Hericium alpestre TaxID=135208 RepID=A0A4Y9ZKF2_9AGAM|nr:hypothetical protein EWM64_g9078 [Hericium alpestre]
MILTLAGENYLNTLLKDEHGRALYRIDTPYRLFGGGRTTVTRLTGQTDHDIAWIEWNMLSPDEFHQHGRTVEASQHLPHKGFFGTCVSSFSRRDDVLIESRKRVLVASDGQSYVWKDGSHGVKVNHTAVPTCPAVVCSADPSPPNPRQLDCDDAALSRVAEYHTRSLGFFSKGHPAYLEIAADGVPILDDIVASFVYMEKKRQQRKRSRASAAAGASASAGA